MSPSDKENMKIVDDILIKVIAGGIVFGRALASTLDYRVIEKEAATARELATAIVKPGK
jgi:hypothetical protein